MGRTRELELSPTGPEDADARSGSIFFVGTATVIIRYGGFTILTDPNFLHAGDHVHLGYGIRSKRETDPAINIDELPPVDFVVLSHYHGDHFDRIAEKKLDETLPIVTTHHAARELEEKGFRATYPLETWEEFRISKGDARVTVTSMPGRHAPGVLAKALPPVMGSVLEFCPPEYEDEIAFRTYITGDTLMYDELEEIPKRYPQIDIALLHLGGTKVLGLLLTMDAAQGVEAVELFDPNTAIPIHYNDYGVFKSRLDEFERAVAEAGLEGRVTYLSHGDTFTFDVPATQRE